ncbi:MAG TPA: hypothetical protein VGM44_16495, partial [Polyangiaceae bacterium]
MLSSVHANAEGTSQVEVAAFDARGWLRPGTGHLAISREIPQFLPADPTQIPALDASRLVFDGLGATPGALQLGTYSSTGALLDLIANPSLTRAPCPPGSSSHECWATLPILLTPDKLDREYAAAKGRSLEA